jgi:hypothetical protein
MPAHEDAPVFTYQTRVPITTEQDQLLREYGRHFGQVERTLFADMQRGQDASRLKSEYLDRFDITARRFNAVRIQLLGKMAAIKQLIPLPIEDLKTKIKKAKKVLARLIKKCLPGSQKVHQKKRRLACLQSRLEQLQADQESGRVRICFGSRKLFHAQFHPQANGFHSHAEWQEAWTEARSRQFFVIGSKDETAGCQKLCRHGGSGRQLLTSPAASEPSKGKILELVQLPNRKGKQVTLPLPARNRGRHVWAFWSKVSRQMRAALAAHVQSLSGTPASKPAALCCQPLRAT